MLFGIQGSGFGLYGYLPALLADGHDVVLPQRYRRIMEGRADLVHQISRARFVSDEAEVLSMVDALVFAVRPEDQASKLPATLASPRLRYLMLEKPLAPNPIQSGDLLALLDVSQIRYRIGYTLLSTRWAKELVRRGRPRSRWRITWRFNAHHYVHDINTWKRWHNEGGGAIRFYGIHLLALLAAFGYRDVLKASAAGEGGECRFFQATMMGPDLPECTVEVDSAAPHAVFSIDSETNSAMHAVVNLAEPFGAEENIPEQDVRVNVLMQLVRDLVSNETPKPDYYGTTNRLWAELEAAAGNFRQWS